MLSTITLAALALAAPQPADELALYQRAAEHHWHATVPCLRVTWAPAKGHESYPTTAEIGGCQLWINPRFWDVYLPEWRCDAIVHEYGHLLGREHTDDMSVMDPMHVRSPRECPRRASRRPSKSFLRRVATKRLGTTRTRSARP